MTDGTEAPEQACSAEGDLRPRIGISSCLVGEEVRYDGAHRDDRTLREFFGDQVIWISVCPEVESGMGVPREPVRLVRKEQGIRMLGVHSETDWTENMEKFSARRALELTGLSGFVLKARSPSCGVFEVKVFPEPIGPRAEAGAPSETGRGLFAEALAAAYPELPLEEDGRLQDPAVREEFLARVLEYQAGRA